MRQCKVFVQNRYAGLLKEKSRDEYIFTYEKEYLEDKDTMPVSLTMPKRKKPYKSDVLFPYFFNILSEGENRKMQSQWLHIDEFSYSCRYCLLLHNSKIYYKNENRIVF